MTAERRKHPRQQTKISATLVARDGLARIPVAITDVSLGGARVHYPADLEPIGELYLLVPEHSIWPCRLVWHQHPSLGLRFIETVDD